MHIHFFRGCRLISDILSDYLQPASTHCSPDTEPLHRPAARVRAVSHTGSRSKVTVSRSRGKARPHQGRPSCNQLLHIQLLGCECGQNLEKLTRILHLRKKWKFKMLWTNLIKLFFRTPRISTVNVFALSGAVLTVTSTCLSPHLSECSMRAPADQLGNNSLKKVRISLHWLTKSLRNSALKSVCNSGFCFSFFSRTQKGTVNLFLSVWPYQGLPLWHLWWRPPPNSYWDPQT